MIIWEEPYFDKDGNEMIKKLFSDKHPRKEVCCNKCWYAEKHLEFGYVRCRRFPDGKGWAVMNSPDKDWCGEWKEAY